MNNPGARAADPATSHEADETAVRSWRAGALARGDDKDRKGAPLTSQEIMALRRRAESFVHALHCQGFGTAKSQRLDGLSIFIQETRRRVPASWARFRRPHRLEQGRGAFPNQRSRALFAKFERLKSDPGAVTPQALALKQKRKREEIVRQQGEKRARIERAFPHFGVSLILDLVDQALEYEERVGRPWVTQDQRGARR